MFLESWLALSFFGIFFLAILIALFFGAGIFLIYGIQLRKRGGLKSSWFMVSSSGILIVTIVGLLIYLFAGIGERKEVVLDLRKSQSELLADLKNSCMSSCASAQVIIVFSKKLQLPVLASSIYWSANSDQTINFISVMGSKSYTLESAHSLLFEYIATYSQQINPDSMKKFESVGNWVLACCKNNVVYSEVNSIKLRSTLGVELRKNVDQISFTYSLTPNP